MKRAAMVSALLLAPSAAFAVSSPFGIATPDGGGAIGWAGPFRGFFVWVAAQQSSFYHALTAALSSLSESGHAAWFLVGLSFAYGVFHAVGPGHGKAVITSYLLATGETLKRGVAISFASAFVQAATAIVVVSIGTIVLRVTAVTMTRATDALEIASFAMIALCGVWLLWSKTVGGHAHGGDNAAPHVHDATCAINGHNRLGRRPAEPAGATFPAGPFAVADLGQQRLAYGRFSASAATAGDASTALACDCGHAHIPDPATLTAPLTLRSGLAAVLAVGIRPCSGAIIVLVFALSQQLWWAGILSVLAMSLGTGLTVAALATLAVKAKDVAIRFTGDGRSATGARVLRGLELAAAAGILLFGLAMLGGALAGV